MGQTAAGANVLFVLFRRHRLSCLSYLSDSGLPLVLFVTFVTQPINDALDALIAIPACG
jgi:hypothetical protein